MHSCYLAVITNQKLWSLYILIYIFETNFFFIILFYFLLLPPLVLYVLFNILRRSSKKKQPLISMWTFFFMSLLFLQRMALIWRTKAKRVDSRWTMDCTWTCLTRENSDAGLDYGKATKVCITNRSIIPNPCNRLCSVTRLLNWTVLASFVWNTQLVFFFPLCFLWKDKFYQKETNAWCTVVETVQPWGNHHCASTWDWTLKM